MRRKRSEHFCFCRAGRKVERSVERIEREDIAMFTRFIVGWRARAHIAFRAITIEPYCADGCALGNLSYGSGNIVEHPVIVYIFTDRIFHDLGYVGVLHDEYE